MIRTLLVLGTVIGAVKASEAVQHAHKLDQAGDEVACMNEIDVAKSQLGLR